MMTRAEAYRQVIAEGAERGAWRTLRQGESEAALRAHYADYTYRQELNLAAHTARESLARAVTALPMDRAAHHDSSVTDLRSVRRARFNLAGGIGWVRLAVRVYHA